VGRPSGDGHDNGHEQPDSKSENQREHTASITCGCGNFGDAKCAAGRRERGPDRSCACKAAQYPSPRLRGEGRGEGLVRLPEYRQVREIVFYLAGRIG